MGVRLDTLKARLAEIADLQAAEAVLSWDQHTYMPPAAGQGRAEQIATLQGFVHRLMVADDTRLMLDGAQDEVADQSPDDDGRALVEVVRWDVDDSLKLPESLVVERARTGALALEAWSDSRSRSDYSRFAPFLRKILDLERQVAECRGYDVHPYDALLQAYERGARTEDLKKLFGTLRARLTPLVRSILDAAGDPAHLPAAVYPTPVQEGVAHRLAASIGYDFQRGRIDPTVHPFASGITRNDVRITVRYDKHDPLKSIFAVLHETGHALYEQGMPESFERTPLRAGASLGVHESQSRLWENLVGRSRAFWGCHLPALRADFPDALGKVDEEQFYRAANVVQPSFIRVDADEVTYNLHIILRFEMEIALIEGSLAVEDAPAAWNEKVQSLLGITPPDDRRGILQDVHWSMGAIGYFPTYTLGTLLACQLWESALEADASIPEGIAIGDCSRLLTWLRETIHQHGRKYLPDDLTVRATGRPLTAEPFLRYLDGKYGS